MAHRGRARTPSRSICDSLRTAVHREFKEKLYKAVQEHYDVSHNGLTNMLTRKNKEVPQPRFDNLTPREMMIHVSEDIIKKEKSNGYFAERVACDFQPGSVAIISDCGFPVEMDVMKMTVGADGVFLVHLYRSGCSFDGDSRCYLSDPDIIIRNDGDLEEFKSTATDRILTQVAHICRGTAIIHP